MKTARITILALITGSIFLLNHIIGNPPHETAAWFAFGYVLADAFMGLIRD